MAPVKTLVLEASTYEGSAALLHHGALVGERTVAMRGREHEALMAAVGDLLGEHHVPAASLGRIVCGAGPGSFTSLRIAAAIAKGLCLATGAQLVPVSSLLLMAASWRPQAPERVLALLDAMRGEYYAQLFSVGPDAEPEVLNEPALVSEAGLAEVAHRLDAVVIGPAREGVRRVLPRADAAVRITNMLAETEPANLAAWEPAYGRLAEAQVKWEALHGRPLPV